MRSEGHRRAAWSRALVLAVACSLVSPEVRARLWTSRSGSQIEAEFVEMQEEFVILRTSDGRQFKIQKFNLCAADQAFLKEVQLEPTPAAPPTPVPAPAPVPPAVPRPAVAPPAAAAETAATVSATAWISYVAPEPMSTDRWPGLVATNIPRMMLVGLQYGPTPSEVLYCAFENVDPQQPPALLHLYSPAAEGFTKTVTLPGVRRKVEEQRVTSFRDVRLKAVFGEVHLSAILEFMGGIGRPDTVLLTGTMQLARTGHSSSFFIAGYLNNDFIYGGGFINVVPLLARPELSVKPWMMRGPVLTGFCKMGRWSLAPGSGMGAGITVEVADRESGRVLDRLKTEINEKKLLAGEPEKAIFQRLALQAGRKVQIRSVLDLGPLLGCVEKSVNFY